MQFIAPVGCVRLCHTLIDRMLGLRLQAIHLLLQETELGIQSVISFYSICRLLADCQHAKETRGLLCGAGLPLTNKLCVAELDRIVELGGKNNCELATGA